MSFYPKAGFSVTRESNPKTTRSNFFMSESAANQNCVDQLTVLLQYGDSDLAVIPTIQHSWLEFTECLTEENLRVWRSLRNKKGQAPK